MMSVPTELEPIAGSLVRGVCRNGEIADVIMDELAMESHAIFRGYCGAMVLLRCCHERREAVSFRPISQTLYIYHATCLLP